MEKALILLSVAMVFFISIAFASLYGILAIEYPQKELMTENPFEEKDIFQILESPQNETEIDFLGKQLETVIKERDGNVDMITYNERLKIILKYRPEIKGYLNQEGRYDIPQNAKRLVSEIKDDKSFSKTVENIHIWIIENIDYIENDRWYTATEVFNGKKGNCNGISFLSCGMLREAGIPCVVLGNEKHAWTEYLYVDEYGRFVWIIWDQGLTGFKAMEKNVFKDEFK